MIRHILKDGKVKTDIKGHIVKYEDAKNLYDVLRKEYIQCQSQTN